MPERDQDPFKDLFNKGSLFPFFITEIFGISKGFRYMIFQLEEYFGFSTDQGNLLLVAETPVIKISRRDHKALIDDHQFCMQVMEKKEFQFHIAFIKQSEVLIP